MVLRRAGDKVCSSCVVCSGEKNAMSVLKGGGPLPIVSGLGEEGVIYRGEMDDK